MRSLNISAGGMLAQQLNVEVISHNLAAMNVAGHKAQRVEFADMAYQNVRMAGTNTSSNTVLPTGMQVGLGVKPVAITRILLPGDFKATGNPLDLAVEGKGYLQVTMPNNTTAYTRAGDLQIGPTGIIVTLEGYPVAPQITIPPEALEIAIGPTGEVLARLSGTPTPQNLGIIQLANFINPGGLEGIGDRLFVESVASGSATISNPGDPGFGYLKQGFLENANTDPIDQMTRLVEAQRLYEMNAQGVQVSSEMMSTSNRLRSS